MSQNPAPAAPATPTAAITVATSVISALLLWCGTTLQKTQIELAQVQTELVNIRSDLAEDAADSKQRDLQIQALAARVLTLENRRHD